jgi:hypothetical protein
MNWNLKKKNNKVTNPHKMIILHDFQISFKTLSAGALTNVTLFHCIFDGKRFDLTNLD